MTGDLHVIKFFYCRITNTIKQYKPLKIIADTAVKYNNRHIIEWVSGYRLYTLSQKIINYAASTSNFNLLLIGIHDNQTFLATIYSATIAAKLGNVTVIKFLLNILDTTRPVKIGYNRLLKFKKLLCKSIRWVALKYSQKNVTNFMLKYK
jgi:hypothetical protein